MELRERLAQEESRHQEELNRVRQEAEQSVRQQEEGAASYKEQVRQHSVTICTMEERLDKVVKKNKDYQAEITQLKKTINGGSLLPGLTTPPTDL